MDFYRWRLVTSFGTEGSEAGNFCRPWGVAITRYSDSTVWSNYLIAIADRSNNRIQVFKFDSISQSVTFLHMFGDGPGTRHGQFDRPAGIVFNSNLEHIIVADKDNHRVQVFDLSGSYLFKFGERGANSGQFSYPWDIDVCRSTHNILVSDTRNRRVQIFDKLGSYITHFNQPLDSPRGVAYFGSDQVLVSDFNKHRLIMITQNEQEEHQVTSSTVSSATSGNTNSTNEASSYLRNNSNNNNNYNLNNHLPHHQKQAIGAVISRSRQLPSLVQHVGKTSQAFYESKFIGFGEGSSWGEFLRPQGVTTNGSLVFCSDSRNNRVACWNKDTKSFNYISKDIVELDRPAGLAAIDSYIVIVDFGNNRVHICQYLMNMDFYRWRLVTSFGMEGSEAGNFCRPWGVAIARYSDSASWSNYLIAIADRSNNRIQVFKFDSISQSVTFLHMFGDGPGTRHGQFDRPAGIVFNPNLEHIIVADKDNHRVQVFDLSGSYLFKFGERGSKSGQFSYPWDIDVNRSTHNILVSDTRNRRVQIFNKLGRYITHFNQPVDSPRGVAYFSPNQVLVSDFNKHRLIMITQSEQEEHLVTSSSLLSATSGNTTSTNETASYLTNNSNNNNDYNLNNHLPHHQKLAIGAAITRSQHLPSLMQQAGKASQTFYESKFIGFGEGSSWGEFLRPQGVTTNGSLVFCSDSRNNRVACWDKDTKSFNYISKDIVELDRPAGLAAIDSYIVIVDFGNNRVHICQNTGMLTF